ncbi:aminotransferase class III-fold pyridoxal phosphate-dependent enzyme [Pseudorhodoferax sp.]|uniref:aminotransferase class III-fold pyridoxal phosphate-dependent enzyme n=1 Tax=Pseudorhodoferax sp. TaxID=1993553 RepID=UPI002DD69D5C|nr:aminotransferase class III-fold pyridoxal phosphate-dependent enzyme [Pseudorhodoferax sp.]
MPTTQRPEAVFTHGQGSWLWSSDGRHYLDLVQGWAVNTLGHAPPAVTQALAAQAGRLLQAGPGLYNDRAVELAARLAGLSGLERAYFTGSGAEANEGAIKLARKWGQVHRGGAHQIITFDNAFHGRTLATMSASGKPGFERLFEPKVPGFPKARLNDLASVAALIGPQTVAVLLEPIQGEAGVIEAEAGFLQDLRRLCDELGLLLMFDEVQTGVGRTGQLWGWQASGVKPDVMTLGKGLGGGAPIGALLAREAVCCFAPGDQGGTYHGNPLMCAAALAVLDAVTAPGFLAQAQQRGEQLHAGLQALARGLGSGPVRGRGLLLALELPQPGQATRVAETLRAQARGSQPGLLVNAVRPERLRFVPALTISAGEIDLALKMLGDALQR